MSKVLKSLVNVYPICVIMFLDTKYSLTREREREREYLERERTLTPWWHEEASRSAAFSLAPSVPSIPSRARINSPVDPLSTPKS